MKLSKLASFVVRSGQCFATAFVVLMLFHLCLLIYYVQAALHIEKRK